MDKADNKNSSKWPEAVRLKPKRFSQSRKRLGPNMDHHLESKVRLLGSDLCKTFRCHLGAVRPLVVLYLVAMTCNIIPHGDLGLVPALDFTRTWAWQF
jgi:hypothetical protein